jgi:hypothetical protein
VTLVRKIEVARMKQYASGDSRPSALVLAFATTVALAACVSAKVEGGSGRCATTDDCDEGWICDLATRRCVELCVLDSDCLPDESCSDGVCIAVTAPECHTDADCITPGICRDPSTAHCEAGRCSYGLAPVGATCVNACVEGTATCNATGQCTGAPKVCDAPPSSRCEGDTCVTFVQVGYCHEGLGVCVYDEVRIPTGPGTCPMECATCDGVVCTETHGGCQSNGHCVPTPSGHCEYEVALDGTNCFVPTDVSTPSGHCLAGACIACSGGAQQTEDCALCKGQRTRTCSDGLWGAWSTCSNEAYAGVCNDGETQTEACGAACTTRSRSCGSNCLWGDWGDCSTGCTPDAVEYRCIGNTQSRTCQSDCTWGEWTGTAECLPGASSSQTCCESGTQARTCRADCTWDAFGACSVGTCTPGVIDTGGACGDCGTERKICTLQCSWPLTYTCTGEGNCTPEEVAYGGGCGDCGTWTKTCTAQCDWPVDFTCTGEGVCGGGETRIISGSCGNCGDKQQTCLAGCSWPVDTVFDCIDQGECAATTTRTINHACSVDQLSHIWDNQTCSASCAWATTGSGSESCGAYKCNAGGCPNSCTANSQCSGSNVCRAGECTTPGTPGQVCDTADGDADCAQTPATQTCSAGVCKRKTGQLCTGDADGSLCADGFCDCASNSCATKRCATLACTGCNGINTAGTGCTSVPHEEDWNNYCAGTCNGSGGCHAQTGESCLGATTNCEAGLTCYFSSASTMVCGATTLGCVGCRGVNAGGTACVNVPDNQDWNGYCPSSASYSTDCNGLGACNYLPGQAGCTSDAECTTGYYCECGDLTCSINRCASAPCSQCTYASSTSPYGCSYARTGAACSGCATEPYCECTSSNTCLVSIGSSCEADEECATGYCECAYEYCYGYGMGTLCNRQPCHNWNGSCSYDPDPTDYDCPYGDPYWVTEWSAGLCGSAGYCDSNHMCVY